MPWRVFGFIGLLIVVTAFTALNLDHRSDVSLGFHTFDAAPVFLTSLIAFTLGAVLAVLLTMPRQPAAPRALPAAPQPEEAPAAEAVSGSDDVAMTPESAAEGAAEAPAEDLKNRPHRKARGWRLGGRRRKEAQD